MKNTSRAWIHDATRSGTAVMIPPMPVAAPPMRARLACASWPSAPARAGRRPGAPASRPPRRPAGRLSAAARATCSGARSGSSRRRCSRPRGSPARGRRASSAGRRTPTVNLPDRPGPYVRADGRKWWTLVAVCVATFMLLLDITIVNVALPDIERSLDASFSDLQWVIDAYALTLAALLLTGGSLADLFGRRLIFVIGLAVFTAASLLCGLAGLADAPYAGAGAAGDRRRVHVRHLAGAAGLGYQGRDRGTAFGVWGAVTGASVAVGPLVGGALTDGSAGRRSSSSTSRSGSARSRSRCAGPRVARPGSGQLDWPGPVTFSAGLFLLVFALIRGNAEGWEPADPRDARRRRRCCWSPSCSSSAASRTRCSTSRCSASRPSTARRIAAFVLSASMFSMFLYLTLYLQNVLGYSALETGLRFLPITVVSFFLAPVSGKLAERYGARWFIGAGLAPVGLGLLLMTGVDPGDDWTALLAGLPRGGRRHRPRQPGARHDRHRRRRAAAGGHGLGHQLDVPPDRHRDRDRGLGGDLPAHRGRRVPPARDGRGGAARRGRRQRRRLRVVRRVPRARRGGTCCWPGARRSCTASTRSSSGGDPGLRRRARSARCWSAGATSSAAPGWLGFTAAARAAASVATTASGLGGDLAPRDADDAVAGGQELSVAAPVALERGTRAVKSVAVDLDDQAPVRPQDVHLVAADAHVRPREREPRGADEVEQSCLGLGAREARLGAAGGVEPSGTAAVRVARDGRRRARARGRAARPPRRVS